MNKLILLILFCCDVFAQGRRSLLEKHKPLLEAGMGIVHANLPDYPGADHNQSVTIPFPVFIYRGKIVRSDEEGLIRTRFFKTDRTEISLSLAGSLPAKSDENKTRAGMPNLKWLAEFGPSFVYKIVPAKADRQYKIELHLPLRYAFSTNIKRWDHEGFIVNPFLSFVKEGFIGDKTFLFATLGANWASREFMHYFYGVDGQFATALRPQYSARAGYLGAYTSLGVSTTFKKKYTVFGGAFHSNYSDASNENSPLLVKKRTLAVAIGFIWYFYESERIGVN